MSLCDLGSASEASRDIFEKTLIGFLSTTPRNYKYMILALTPQKISDYEAPLNSRHHAELLGCRS